MTEDQAKAVYETQRKQYPKLDPWEALTPDKRKPWYAEAERQAERDEAQQRLLSILEPEIPDTTINSVWLSMAISLKRIADLIESDYRQGYL